MFRPGPMGTDPELSCARKNGREEVEYPHPLLGRDAVGDLRHHGLPGAGDAGGADPGRLFARRRRPAAPRHGQEEGRGDGASTARSSATAPPRNAIGEDKADEIFDLMEKFAGYGFNKSHAAAYSLLAYHTGWLKVHYTAEFFCANMTVEMDDTDKLKVLFEDAQNNFGLTFEPPDVNRGGYRFEPISDKAIRYGLGAVKGTGQQAIDAIVRRPGRGRAVHEPVRLLRAGRPHPAQQAHRRSADQGRRLRFAAAQSGVADRFGGPGLRFRQRDRGQCQPGRPVRHGRFACGEHAGAAAGRGHALGREGAPDLREDRGRLLPVGPPVRRGGAGGAALRQAPDRRPDRHARAAAAGRHRQRFPRDQRPARQAGPVQAGRQVGHHRGHRRRSA